MSFHLLQGLLDQVTNVVCILLRVVDGVADVFVSMSEQIHNGQDLAIVGHEGLCDCLRRADEKLDLLERLHHDFLLLGLESILDRDDQLRQDWKNLVLAADD